MMEQETVIINLTPHAVAVAGKRIPPSGTVARVSASYVEVGAVAGVPLYRVEWGAVTGLPAPEPGRLYLVSTMVAEAARRPDVVAPATGHPATRRDEAGRIVEVPGLIQSGSTPTRSSPGPTREVQND